MEFFSGLVLDRQDDPQGTLLQQEGVKVASGDPASYEQLPDHLFALCMRQEGVELRKYAMHTAEATAESMLYFLKLGHRLPDVAQKHAAQNLCVGASWYALPVPSVVADIAQAKIAGVATPFLRGLGGSVVNGAKNALTSFAKNPVSSVSGALGKGLGAATAVGSLGSAAGQVKQNLGQVAAAGGNITPLSHFGG